MTVSADSQQKIDAYLKTLRRRLRGMHDEDARDIVEELRSHILDKAAAAGDVTPAGVEAALAALGSPEELASQYVTDELVARAQVSRSPWLILRSLFRWATLSVAGFFALIGALCGYFVAGALFLCAMLKAIHPKTAGLWLIPRGDDSEISLRLGFGSTPLDGRELLGWWVIPLGLIIGMGIVFFTFHFGLWSIRKFRRARPAPIH
jgi:hypothetical protein